MTKHKKHDKDFFEKIMRKNSLSRERSFAKKEDHHKKQLKAFREDLSSMPIMPEDLREERYNKMMAICEHFATTAKDRDDENMFHFWPKYLSVFMTPRLFDMIPNSWFTQEFGFCFACEHFKGQKKGHHKFFHSLQNRKVIGLFGKCEKYNNNRGSVNISKYNNHVMPVYRCKGWEPSPFYEQLIRHRIAQIFIYDAEDYTYEMFIKEVDKVDVFDFMAEDNNSTMIY